MKCVCGCTAHETECDCGCVEYEPDDGTDGDMAMGWPKGTQAYHGIYNQPYRDSLSTKEIS